LEKNVFDGVLTDPTAIFYGRNAIFMDPAAFYGHDVVLGARCFLV
jgi:hypothetical protein